MADRTKRFALISKFEKMFKAKMGRPITLNKNKEQWAADALLETYTPQELDVIFTHYFKVNDSPSWNRLAYNADKLLQYVQDAAEDAANRIEMRKRAEKWLNES